MTNLVSDKDFIDYVIHYGSSLGLPSTDPSGYSVRDMSGNINRVRRVSLHYGDMNLSFVVKHVPEGGRLERYPSVIFPESRLDFEAGWFKAAGSIHNEAADKQGRSPVRPPAVFIHSSADRAIIMEDFGEVLSLTKLLLSDTDAANTLHNIGSFLGNIHANTYGSTDVNNPSAEKNRPFIYSLAVEEPEFIREIWEQKEEDEKKLTELIATQEWFLNKYGKDLRPALKGLVDNFKSCPSIVLTHGDLHGQSILILPDGSAGIVDAELCDSGDPTFDLGTLLAHVWTTSTIKDSKTDALFRLAFSLWQGYQEALSGSIYLSRKQIVDLKHRIIKHAGCEIIRRLIGAAGFPFDMDDDIKRRLLTDSVRLLTQPEMVSCFAPRMAATRLHR